MRYSVLALVSFGAATLGGCSGGSSTLGAPIASAERLLLINSTAIMLVVVVPVILATLAFAWWYRSSNTRAVRSSELAYEGRIEFVTWSIPALTVSPSRRGHLDRLESARPARSDPSARPARSAWTSWRSIGNGCSSIRDQGIAAVNQLTIPAETPVSFRLDLGDGDELLLRAAARQPDLHAWAA